MSNQIQYFTVAVTTATLNTSQVQVDKYDQLLVSIPAVSGVFASSAVQITLQGAAFAGQTMQDMSYFDYVNATPKTSVITVSTGGVYEMPYPGAMQYLRLGFSTATTNATSIYLVTPKSNY